MDIDLLDCIPKIRQIIATFVLMIEIDLLYRPRIAEVIDSKFAVMVPSYDE